MKDQEKDRAGSTPENQDRRQVMKKIATGVGVLAGYSVLPDKWTRPIIGKIALPAHAATSAASVTAAEPATTAAEPAATTQTKVFTLQSAPGNTKKFVWLDKTGAEYGGQVTFDFGSCGTLVVPDAAKSYGADGTTSNYNQAYYFCGTDFAPGAAEYNNGLASVFSPPGCASNTVTMTYTK